MAVVDRLRGFRHDRHAIEWTGLIAGVLRSGGRRLARGIRCSRNGRLHVRTRGLLRPCETRHQRRTGDQHDPDPLTQIRYTAPHASPPTLAKTPDVRPGKEKV